MAACGYGGQGKKDSGKKGMIIAVSSRAPKASRKSGEGNKFFSFFSTKYFSEPRKGCIKVVSYSRDFTLVNPIREHHHQDRHHPLVTMEERRGNSLSLPSPFPSTTNHPLPRFLFLPSVISGLEWLTRVGRGEKRRGLLGGEGGGARKKHPGRKTRILPFFPSRLIPVSGRQEKSPATKNILDKFPGNFSPPLCKGREIKFLPRFS